MSDVLTAYLVRLTEVDQLLFSGDDGKKAEALSRSAELTAGLDEEVAAEVSATVRLAIDGTPEEFVAAQHGIAALQILAATLGEALDGPIFEGFSTYVFEELGDVGMRIGATRPLPMKRLPEAAGNWPDFYTISYLALDEAADFLPGLNETIDSWPASGDPEMFEFYETLEEWLSRAVEAKSDLLFFLS